MFLISLIAFIFGSVMCWVNEIKRAVFLSWAIWLLGFFTLPMVFKQGWPFMVLQTLLAIWLVLKWKIDAARL